MFTFDGHIDTLLQMIDTRKSLEDSDGHVTLERLQTGGISAQIFAVFVEPQFYAGMALHRGLEMIDLFWDMLSSYPEHLKFASNGTDVEQIAESGKIACILAVEGGEVIQGSLANLRNLYRLGVRVLTLTWNYRNMIANSQADGNCGGLSPFGLQTIAEMNRLGMLIDVSHLNEQGFWDVVQHSTDPIIASHSCSRALRDHARNLTDEQVRQLAEQGGVIGVNFLPSFLVANGSATIDDVVRHIEHFINIGGIDCVGLGSDFDGINTTPVGLEGCEKTHHIAARLGEKGHSTMDIEKVMGLNFLRITKQVLG